MAKNTNKRRHATQSASITGKGRKRVQLDSFAAAAPVDVADVNGLTPERMWKEYISQRKPVLIQGHIQDDEWKCSELWSDDYLIATAGEEVVLVEDRSAEPEQGFGKGRKRWICMAEFVKRLAAGDQALYLTSSQVEIGKDGHLQWYTTPLTALAADFPLRPGVMGNLVPQQLNLWMGASRCGSSTGLHHDFHDNLYLLLQGRKRFRLYPPDAAPGMYTTGTISRIHPNGRIVYDGQGDVLADGADRADVSTWMRHVVLDQAVALAGTVGAAAPAADNDDGEGGDGSAVHGEELVEAALEQLLAGAVDAEDGDFELQDDYVEEEEDEDVDETAPGSGCDNAGPPPNSSRPTSSKGRPGEWVIDNNTPPSFSRIDMSLPDEQLRRTFPNFPGKTAAVEVEVSAGQMLYLPAGWFHEVTSSGTGGAARHMAFNYWFHPPDSLHPDDDGFAQPYSSGYWPSLWDSRRKSRQAHADLSSCRRGGMHADAAGLSVDRTACGTSPTAPAPRQQLLSPNFFLGRRAHLLDLYV